MACPAKKLEDEAMPPYGRMALEAIAEFAARPLEEQVQFMKDVGIFDENCDLAPQYRQMADGTGP
jgi:hypothetical protein